MCEYIMDEKYNMICMKLYSKLVIKIVFKIGSSYLKN